MATAPPSPAFPSGVLAVDIPAGEAIVRIHRLTDGPIWFGPAPGAPPSYRFDAPAGQFRTLYAAASLTGAFVETVLRGNRRIVSSAFVNERQWSTLRTGRSLRLAKLFDEGLSWHGVDASVSSSQTYSHSREVAAAIHSHFPDVDGIAYRSKHNNAEICYALFDRVAPTELLLAASTPFEVARSAVDHIVRTHGAAWDTTPPL